jgi:recombination protein U
MKNADYANRGKSLEDLINYANQQYLVKGVALVQKIPTPWTVIRRGIADRLRFPRSEII